ncbi:hypothetical protein SK355_03820 [Candidatus Fukatsuia symbiotica]|uniref:Uncharacterized protein n=1 Tax=Candidatus Fukatsuia symbiotica TaxID=1878942 RepID=A0A2U8I8C6_9GAMM|nr:hypothetical protein [Candidatus Fukatsuia symbiotica]AWK14204.1 hypothetical protein CCS41_06495 [Candidatus Fukatsuia symbiotica]MEA9444446.1 hypothetical protein [Candidatus Fukatsuia symbiotica]
MNSSTGSANKIFTEMEVALLILWLQSPEDFNRKFEHRSPRSVQEKVMDTIAKISKPPGAVPPVDFMV